MIDFIFQLFPDIPTGYSKAFLRTIFRFYLNIGNTDNKLEMRSAKLSRSVGRNLMKLDLIQIILIKLDEINLG